VRLKKSLMVNFYPLEEGNLIPKNAVAALIKLEGSDYLCQLRSNKKGIFYPNHWGLFGGAVEKGEDSKVAIQRELEEELGIRFKNLDYFTEFTFDFSHMNLGTIWRKYYKVDISESDYDKIILGEGDEFNTFTPKEILTKNNTVPYDKFAIWLNEKNI